MGVYVGRQSGDGIGALGNSHLTSEARGDRALDEADARELTMTDPASRAH